MATGKVKDIKLTFWARFPFSNCAVKSVGQYKLCPERKDQRFIVETARRAEWNLFTVTPWLSFQTKDKESSLFQFRFFPLFVSIFTQVKMSSRATWPWLHIWRSNALQRPYSGNTWSIRRSGRKCSTKSFRGCSLVGKSLVALIRFVLFFEQNMIILPCILYMICDYLSLYLTLATITMSRLNAGWVAVRVDDNDLIWTWRKWFEKEIVQEISSSLFPEAAEAVAGRKQR